VTDSNCGILRDLYDTLFGFARVEGIGTCKGDSGGGWYWPHGGQRRALGIHARGVGHDGKVGCHTAGQTENAYFTTLPRINGYLDATAGAGIRVDIR
jgi:streptogrisin C